MSKRPFNLSESELLSMEIQENLFELFDFEGDTIFHKFKHDEVLKNN